MVAIENHFHPITLPLPFQDDVFPDPKYEDTIDHLDPLILHQLLIRAASYHIEEGTYPEFENAILNLASIALIPQESQAFTQLPYSYQTDLTHQLCLHACYFRNPTSLDGVVHSYLHPREARIISSIEDSLVRQALIAVTTELSIRYQSLGYAPPTLHEIQESLAMRHIYHLDFHRYMDKDLTTRTGIIETLCTWGPHNPTKTLTLSQIEMVMATQARADEREDPAYHPE